MLPIWSRNPPGSERQDHERTIMRNLAVVDPLANIDEFHNLDANEAEPEGMPQEAEPEGMPQEAEPEGMPQEIKPEGMPQE
jgi:hypothetical protein